MKDIKIFGKEIIDDKAIKQLQNCLLEDSIGVLTADAHLGYAHPIGGAIAYKEHISISGVGFDIGCGNKAVRTGLRLMDEMDYDTFKKLMKEVSERISFGVGRNNNEPVDHPVLEEIRTANIRAQRKLYNLAKQQLGTVGSGNHFVDIFVDEDGYMWVGVHFGSRGFGHKTATGFIALSQGLEFDGKGKEGSMDSKPILLNINNDIGASYIEAMTLAGKYAYAGRDIVVDKVLEIFGNPNVTKSIHNHHNFAWKENHFGEDYWVVRKGCTPAFPNQEGFIGANMSDNSVIVEGIDCQDAKDGLYSTVHGAGRILSRNEAAGKKKWIFNEEKQRKIPTYVSKGKVDFNNVKTKLENQGIVLYGAGADEAPECYKSLNEVITYQGNTIKVKHVLQPVGVCMASAEVYDPYKD